MTTTLEGGEGSASRLAALYPRKRPGTHCTGGWVGPRAGLDRCGKSHPPPLHRDSIRWKVGLSWTCKLIDTLLVCFDGRFTVVSTKLHYFLSFGLSSPQWAMASSFMRFLDHTQRRNAVGRTPLDEWSALHRDLYDTQYSQQTDIHAPGGIRTHNVSRRAAADLRLRQRGHWDRHKTSLLNLF